MTPELLRAYVRVLVRELTIPLSGVLLTFFLALTDRFAYWQLPLLAGMMLVPLVRLGAPPPPPVDPDPDRELEEIT